MHLIAKRNFYGWLFWQDLSDSAMQRCSQAIAPLQKPETSKRICQKTTADFVTIPKHLLVSHRPKK
jgi:hypothetical protein